MASASRDKDGWIASFRALHAPGTQRRSVRIPADRIRADTADADAKAYAEECDRYCRLIEAGPTPAHIDHAEQLKAITAVQASALRAGSAVPMAMRSTADPMTLRQFFDAHPSTARERGVVEPGAEDSDAGATAYRDHLRQLRAFAEWAGVSTMRDMTLDHVRRWVAVLKQRGHSWDSRRHHLIPLRRAARMAATYGLPDVIGGLKLDTNDQRTRVEVWTLDELARAAVLLSFADHRLPAVIALGGFLGLRPSEIIRLRVGDCAGDVLEVGGRTAKTAASVRSLAMPAIVRTWIAPLLRGREHTDPVIRSSSQGNVGGELGLSGLQNLAGPLLARATGRALPVKVLRKSFATWAIRGGIATDTVEDYLGHRRHNITVVTARHYLEASRIIALRPAAARMDALIREALASARRAMSTTNAYGSRKSLVPLRLRLDTVDF